MNDALQELFVAVRGACSPRAWSLGVELARSDAVDGVELDADVAVLRVRTAGRTVAPTVTLHIEEASWQCSCESSADACEHVAAAAIAFRKVRTEGRILPRTTRIAGLIGYRLRRDGESIAIVRVIATKGAADQPLTASIGGILSGREPGPPFEATKVDLTLERYLRESRVRSYGIDRFADLVPLLAEAPDVCLEGEPVVVREEPLWPRIVLADSADGRGFVLRFELPPELASVVVLGLARCHGTPPALRPMAGIEHAGARFELLPRELAYAAEQAAELVTRIVPAWRAKTNVEVLTTRLGAAPVRVLVRPLIEVSQRGGALHVLCSIAYGDPPCARVVNDRLVHLRGPVPERTPNAERAAAQKLQRELDLAPNRAFELTGLEAYTMAKKLRALDGYTVVGDAHRRCYPEAALTAKVEVAGLAFAVSFETDSGGGCVAQASADSVFSAWTRGENLVPLLGGGWAELPLDWLLRFGHRIREVLEARESDGTVPPHTRPLFAKLCDDLETPRPASLDGLAPLVHDFTVIPRAPLPEGLTATLRPYQQLGVDWLCFLRDADLGGVLADDMGLGKTLESLCALPSGSLIVCPTSVVHNWVAELRRFLPARTVAVYHGSARAIDRSVDIVVTTYSLLRRDIDVLAASPWQAVVLDEAQAIKNPDSQVAQAAFRLRAKFRLALSGTPIENRLEELWSLMHFSNRGLLGGRSAFRDRYERPILAQEPGALERLRERIRPFVLRRMKADVLADLPPRTDAVMHCELDPRERELYESIRLLTRTTVVTQLNAGGSVMLALEALLRLRQAACDSTLVPGHAARAEVSSKIECLLSALEVLVADGHKALVFSQWTSLLDRIEPELGPRGIAHLRLDGSTVDRGVVVSAFQDQAGPPVLLLSLKAGGIGLNLTAADHVFLLDPWWNPATEDQAADRAHRIGQDRPVMVYRLVAKDTVEERILELQERKRQLALAALGDGRMATAITRDDLLALLG
ncbi:MAG: DEAD/DEAH box helicase [Myxococcales bacterium]|nr:DEAD/DEAH box helicase [Myxococcales bacterium]